MAKTHLALVAPSPVNGAVRNRPPRRRPNSVSRAREYLTAAEVERLIAAAGDTRYGHRNATMVLIAFRHGLRPVEAVSLRWDGIDFDHGRLRVTRVKGSEDSTHPLSGRELRALGRLKREQAPPSPFVFTSERDAPFSTLGFRTMIERLGEAAGFEYRCIRIGCAMRAATHWRTKASITRTLQDYLGHRNIQHTVRYTKLSESKFKNLWAD